MSDLPGDASPSAPAAAGRAVSIWLFIVAAFVCAMILVGGATRLTDSGLSITEWRPVTGAIPPLSEEAWQREFDLYRQIPEYTEQNAGMSLGEFQFIYWWEWGHRQLGRTIGLVYALPLAFFWLTGRLTRRLKPRLVALLFLGGLQGAIGWWMVSSGLVDRLDVSQYRLATHLGMAFVILAASVWLGLEARYGPPPARAHRLTGWALAFWGFVFFQIILGAFVAGLDAGRILNTWPLFEGRLIPDGYLSGMPWLQAAFESRPAVQMHHRWTGYLVAIAALALAAAFWRSQRSELRPMSLAIAGATLFQVALGVVTLIAYAPLGLSLIHQAGAIILFIAAGLASWRARRAV